MKTISFITISGVIIFSFLSCSKQVPASSQQEEIICVKAETLVETNASVPIHCSGVLTSKRMIKLSFKTGGIISHIAVDEGSQVKKGQVIATLDMTEISAQVNQARLAYEKTERDLNRVKNLYTDTVATLEQLQDATSAYQAAMETKNIAEFNQQYSLITAPANGRIIAKLAEEHELVGTGMPVLVFSEQGTDEWIVRAGISDKDIIRIKKGDKAQVEVDAFPGVVFPASVSLISEAADPQSGTFEVEIAVTPNSEKFLNGLVAKVKIEPMNGHLVTLVPPEAVTEADGHKGYVYVVEKADSTAKKIPVTIAYLQNSEVAVIEPLNKMGLVITKGAAYLEDGSKISLSK